MDYQSAAETPFFLADDALFVEMESETVILSHAAGSYFGLRGAARHVLDLLQQGTTLTEMADRVCALYEVSPEEAAADIRRVLQALAEKRLLRPSNGA